MPGTDTLLTARKTLNEICDTPERIISVYSLEQHVWANGNSKDAIRSRQPELQTIEEFQIDPVRPFLNDILRNIAAPYKPERKDNPIGQGYWIQAEFGSGKSHLLCCLAALALGSQEAWSLVQQKEQKAGRGKREALYQFWEDGLKAKNTDGKKGIFVIVMTLVGVGGGTVGTANKGGRLAEYILDAAKKQIQAELGRNLSLYPTELLADKFLADQDLYRDRLKKFLKNPKFFEEDEFEEVDEFIQAIQQNRSPEYKRSCGNKLWRFYTEDLGVQPHIAAETEDILKHMVETILSEGYSGVLLVLDEVSLFMKTRDDEQRADDEKTLVVLSNRLAKVHNLPVWTVCSAQQALESKMGVKNIIADDRLKLVKLLEGDNDYYDIVLSRVREIKDPTAIANYYLYYKRGFTWTNSIGLDEFSHFFPFHKPALEVLRAITSELTTARSAIHFMHQTLKHQIKHQGQELIRLWELFDEAVRYEEDPSGIHAGIAAIKTKREQDYVAYEACKRQIDGLTKGSLKVHRDKAIKVIQTLFLYHVSRTRQQGIAPEEIANSVLIERSPDANTDENIQHYETLAENLKKELRQIAQSFDDDAQPRYRFDPVFTGVDPRVEFSKARDLAESNELMQREARDQLLALDVWTVKTRQMTLDLSNGVRSIFLEIATKAQELEINWQGRQTFGSVGLKDLGQVATDDLPLPEVDSAQTDHDFAVFIGKKPIPFATVTKLLARRKDPRVLIWTPDEFTSEERDRLLDFAAYRKLVADYQGKDTEDAVAVINWVSNSLQADMAKIAKVIENSYARGRIDTLHITQMEFRVAGGLASTLSPLVDHILDATYESKDIKFDAPFTLRKEEGVKVINGIVKTGEIPKGVKPNQNISAAQNFGFGLKIMKKSAERQLDTADNPHAQALWSFIESHLADDSHPMKVETLYKNFMGIGGPKDYGLTRRMVQIYLLCLVQQGKIRIHLSSKSGLTESFIDYSNIAAIEFSVKVLDAWTDVQKMAKPENWETLRPYASKLLGEDISATHDDTKISEYRKKLRDLFALEKPDARRVVDKARSLFEALNATNPYEQEIQQIAQLFATDIESGDDINLLLYGLQQALKYQAFDKNVAASAEIDDLANRLKNYRDLQQFLTHEADLKTAYTYCTSIPSDVSELQRTYEIRTAVVQKLANLQTYIDSDVKLKTELIGQFPPEPSETGTANALMQEYKTVYATLHDAALNKLDEHRQSIEGLLKSNELRALEILEGITALQPSIYDRTQQDLMKLKERIFSCGDASHASVEKSLKSSPIHSCGLNFDNYADYLAEAQQAVEKARFLVEDVVDRKMEVFLNASVQERLQQGASEPAIAQLLECSTVASIQAYLVATSLQDASIVGTINHYLKHVVTKTVRLADFKPSTTTVQPDQIAMIAREFQLYLEAQLSEVDGDEDTLPILQLE